jgi:hypothetical protein
MKFKIPGFEQIKQTYIWFASSLTNFLAAFMFFLTEDAKNLVCIM